MKIFRWNIEKNELLKNARGVCFEQVVILMEKENVHDTIEHPNQNKYPGQKIAIVMIDNYYYLVPYVQNNNEIFLKTIIPGRKATNKYMRSKKMKKIVLDAEEKNFLDSCERDEWKTIKNPRAEIKMLSEYAKNTLQKDKRINIRMSSKDLNEVQVIAAQEGIPYQTLIASIIHKYVSGYLFEKRKIHY